MKILLTGTTGVLGSHLYSVLSSGHKIYSLVRDAEKKAAKLSRIGMSSDDIIEGDLEKKRLGLSGESLSRLRSIGIDMILHGAGSVKFDEKYCDRTINTNQVGTERIIHLAKALKIQDLHFISTAYAPFKRNPYETSKLAAEKLVADSGLSYNIYRLGILVGESMSCAISGFNGFYGYVMGPYFMAEAIRQKRNDLNPVTLSISVPCTFTSTINIVPIDWVVSQLAAFIDLGTHGETHHITTPTPPLTSWVLNVIFDHLNINGIHYLDCKGSPPIKNTNGNGYLQRLFDKHAEIFLPYLVGEEPFDVSSARKRLGILYEAPPKVNKEWIHGLLDYAIKHNFGRKIKE